MKLTGHWILGCVYFLLAGCEGPIPKIYEEFGKIKESCEFVQTPEFYVKYNVNSARNIIVRYTFALEKGQRQYLAGCGPIMISTDADLDGYYPDANNPISRVIFYQFKAEQRQEIPFFIECAVGGLAPYTSFMKSANKKFVIERNGSDFSCTVNTDADSSPKILQKP